MSEAVEVFVWLTLYFVALLSVPSSREHKGYGWRLLRRIPPWRFFPRVHPDPLASLHILWRWMWLYWPLVVTGEVFLPESLPGYVPAFSTVIALCVDDILNGDDDTRRRRYEWARNKVKWLMELPAPPQEVKVRS